MGLAVQGIGVGVAELVDLAGNVTSAHTIDWPGLSAQAAFSKLAPAIVESDVRAPALAEAMFGAGRSYRLFAYVTIGTGISYCLVQDGKPYAGARGNALVLTSGPLTFRCPGCGAVSQSIVEEIASGPALAAHYSQLSAVQVTKAEAVLAAVEAGDTIAIQTVETAAEALGSSVGFMINLLDPEAVIVGGGLGLAGGLYWDRFVASTRAHIYADATRDLPIRQASLGVDAGLIGAAATIFRRQYNALLVVAVFHFMFAWNDFLGPLIYLDEATEYPLVLGLYAFQTRFGIQWHLLMAATLSVTFPLIVLFFVAQRYFIEGVTLSGLKG